MLTLKRMVGMLFGLVLALPAAAQDEGAAPSASSSEATTLALIRLLVAEGLISSEKAQALLTVAEQQAASAAANRAASDAAAAATPAGAVRVPYVPEVVRRQIRDEVKQEVLAQAKTERWIGPAKIPEWLDRVSFSGDLRVRARGDYFDSNNVEDAIPNFVSINNASLTPQQFADGRGSSRNTSEDEQRQQLRARFTLDADLKDGFSSVIRVATGTRLNPVSTNQDLATTLGNDNINLDRGAIRYQRPLLLATDEIRADVGRFQNPFMTTDLLWDDDVNFDGVAARYSIPASRVFRPFVTAGFFPLEYTQFSSKDKVLYAGQIGTDITPRGNYTGKLGLSLYNYTNLRGRQQNSGDGFDANGQGSECDNNNRNRSTPAFQQFGNSLQQIGCDGDDADTDIDRVQYGLASDFSVLNLTGQVDYAGFKPIMVRLTGDVAVNTAYKEGSVKDRVQQDGGPDSGNALLYEGDGGNVAWLGSVLVGHPTIAKRHDWNASLTYKYIERDAVLDAFNDSDFHLGGTNAKGVVVAGSYGLSDNVWLGARWLSSQEIDGPSFKVDTVLLDLNARF